MHKPVICLGSALLALGWASPARCETRVSASAGRIFGGYLELPGNRLSVGGALSYFANEHLGFELDAAHTSNIFRSSDDTKVTTIFASVVGKTKGRGRVSGLAAVGLGGVRSQMYDFRTRGIVHSWHPCGAVTFGATADLARHVGLRADLRYATALEEEGSNTEVDRRFGSFDVWSATAGAFFRF